MAKRNKTNGNRYNSLARKIVGLTVFLNAIFLVLAVAVLSFIYIGNLKSTRAEQLDTQVMNATGSFEAFVRDTAYDAETLSENQAVIAYLEYLNGDNEPVITDPEDPNYLLYYDFSNLLETMSDFSYQGVYNFVFLATLDNSTIGPNGFFIGTGGVMADTSWNLTERQWYLDLGSAEASVSKPYVDAISGEYAITFAHTVKQDGNTIGYVGIDVLLGSFPDVCVAYDYYTEETSRALAVFSGTDDPLLIHFSETDYPDYNMLDYSQASLQDGTYGFTGQGMAELIAGIGSADPGVMELFGNDYLVGYSPIEGTDWTLAVMIETSPIPTLEATYLVLLAATILLMVLVSFILSKNVRQTLSPIDDILESIEEIKKGNYNVHVNVEKTSELKQVAEAINIMSREIGKQVELVYKSFVYDSVTGLKNRKASHQEIDDIMHQETEKVAVCLLEVDNMKNINVTKGQAVSDEILRLIATDIRKYVTDTEALYFNGGSEFVLLIKNVRTLDRVETEIGRIMELFKEPLDVNNLKIEVVFRAGISIYPSDGKTIVDLIKRCNVALFKARETASAKIIFYNDKLTEEVNFKAQISEQLAMAIKNEQLYLKYQPLVDSKNEIYGFEALARWKSPTLGEISPQIFVANAEESHLIIPIGNWILHQACLAQVEMKKRYGIKFVMSVNVSPIQLMQKDFIDVLTRIVRDTEIDPHFLVLEITEGVLIESSIYVEELMNYVHEIGAKVALDDFGTGYASLTYLKQYPFDNLKIDKSFVDGIFGAKKDHSIIATIVQMVHNLDMKVIAEGVEKRKQYEYLKQIQTDVFQGFLFSKPLNFEEASRYVDQFYKVAKNKRIDVFAGRDYYE